ncbi:MAG TPA: HAMP domain-containing sensor histidine kinase [Acidimicrobiales bacterium]|nr:HAMP domain-containing sensor histidine kinase [Acidimicrobiales bacterium]
MRRRLLLGFIALALVILVGLEVPLGIAEAHRDRSLALAGLRREAATVAGLAGEGFEHRGLAGVRALALHEAATSRTALALMVPGGRALVETGPGIHPLAARLSAGSSQLAASGGMSGEQTGGGVDRLYAAVPVVEPDGPGSPGRGTSSPAARRRPPVLVVTRPDRHLDAQIRHGWVFLTTLGVALLAVAGLGGALLSRTLTRPLRRVEDTVAALGAGDLESRAPIGGAPEVVNLGRQVNDMAARLEELVGMQRAFVADASHQLRSPLTALQLRLETLALDQPGDGDVEGARAEAQRLSHLVDGLLALARAEGARAERAMVDLCEVVAERLGAWAPLAEEGGVTLLAEAAGDVPAWAVPGHLDQILDNLVDNALEAAPPGTTVTLQVVPDPQTPQVHVLDEGPGMTDEARARAFDRFWRHPDQRHGSGLGLAIVSQLTQASGGRVALRPRPGGGLAAVLALEAAPRPHQGPGQLSQPAPPG